MTLTHVKTRPSDPYSSKTFEEERACSLIVRTSSSAAAAMTTTRAQQQNVSATDKAPHDAGTDIVLSDVQGFAVKFHHLRCRVGPFL